MSEVGIDAQLQVQRDAFRLDVRLQLPATGISVLFGRSGCGKTTLLRAIAGLQPAQGQLSFCGERWLDGRYCLPTHRRPLGYVFQEASLFDHLDVRDNLTFGYRRVPRAERHIDLDEATALLGLDALLPRRANQLSGGQRQRVAIARALLTSPRLLLMDEPLASLDLDSKAEILPYLERLHAELSIPVVYVTHSPDEVTRLADHLVLLEAGRVRASGSLNELLTDPDLPLAQLDEAAAVLTATLAEHDAHYHLSTLNVPGGTLSVALSDLPLGTRTRLRILARDVSLALAPPHRSSILNSLPARIQDLTPDRDPGRLLVRLDLGGTSILARITRRSADQLALRPGLDVYAQIKSAALVR